MAVNWLPPVTLTASARPVFLSDEVERHLVPAVDLVADENPELHPLLSGLLVLTSHRIIWIDERSPHDGGRRGFSIPLAAVVHAFSRKKSIRSMFATPRIGIQVKTTPDGRVAENGTTWSDLVVTVVLRGKTDPDLFYGRLLDVLRARAWESVQAPSPSGTAESAAHRDGRISAGENAVRMPVIGVTGILKKEQEQWESMDKSLQEAFQDLNALMSKAKEMVQLADKLRQKLLTSSSTQGNSNDEEVGSKQEMQDWLLSVGIASPVTKESAGALYHQQLSRELADFVKSPLEKAGGMIALIDVYCLYNRARGTALISPDDLLQACALWEKFEVPLMLRKFDSGVMVIQNKTQRDEEVFARIQSLAQNPDALKTGINPSDAALTLGIAPALAKEHLLNAESKGLLCRDISPDGFRFYINLFKELDPSDIFVCKTDGIFQSWLSATSASDLSNKSYHTLRV